MTNQENVIKETKPQNKREETVQVTTVLTVPKAKYERFRRTFDEQSWQDFASCAAGSGGLLDEVL